MNSACPDPSLLVSAREDVLPESLAAEVRAHVAACEICARLEVDLREPVFAEPTLAELAQVRRVVSSAGALPTGKPQWRRGPVVAAAGVAAGLAAGLVMGMISYWPRPRQPERVAQAPARVLMPSPEQRMKPVAQYRLPLALAPLRLPLAAALVLRGKEQDGTGAYLTALGRALEPYRAGRHAEAITRLQDLARRYPRAVEPPFYGGVAQLFAADAAGALRRLQRARELGGEALDDDINWYLAIARERTGDWAGARQLLSALCQNENPYRPQACEALKP